MSRSYLLGVLPTQYGLESHTLTARTLGSQGLTVSALGLGCMGMSQSYGTPEDREERESIATTGTTSGTS